MKKNTEEKMVQKRRVVITGLGAVTPIGNTVPEFWTNVRKGTVGIGEITGFDTKDFKVKLAAQVKDFHGEEKMDAKAARRMELFSQYAVAAAKEALEDAGLDLTKEDLFRAGVIVGSGIGSLSTIEKEYTKILEGRANRVDPLMVPRMISNMAAGNISIQLGIRGKCTNVVTACASGTNCIGDAFRAIQYGDAEIMFAGGAESCICPTGIAGFQALTALSQETDPLRASIPFDVDRKALFLGKVPGSLFWKSWSMPGKETQEFTQSWLDMVRPEMHFILHRHVRMEAVQQGRWSLLCRRQKQSRIRSDISMHMEQGRIIMICLKHGRSNGHLEKQQNR